MGQRASVESITSTSRSYHRPSCCAASESGTLVNTRRPRVQASSFVTAAPCSTRTAPARDSVATCPARSGVSATTTAPSATATRSAAASPYARTPNLVPMARIALCGVCTTERRAGACPPRHRPRGSRRPGQGAPQAAPGSVGVVGWLVLSGIGSPYRLQRRDRGAALGVGTQPRLDDSALLLGGLAIQVVAERDEVDRHHVDMTPQQGDYLLANAIAFRRTASARPICTPTVLGEMVIRSATSR